MTLISWLSNDRHSMATESCAASAFETLATGCWNFFVLSTCKMQRRQPKWGGHFYDNGPLSHTTMALLDVFMYWPSQWACLCVHWSIGSPNLCTDRTQSGELLGGRPPIFTGQFSFDLWCSDFQLLVNSSLKRKMKFAILVSILLAGIPICILPPFFFIFQTIFFLNS